MPAELIYMAELDLEPRRCGSRVPVACRKHLLTDQLKTCCGAIGLMTDPIQSAIRASATQRSESPGSVGDCSGTAKSRLRTAGFGFPGKPGPEAKTESREQS